MIYATRQSQSARSMSVASDIFFRRYKRGFIDIPFAEIIRSTGFLVAVSSYQSNSFFFVEFSLFRALRLSSIARANRVWHVSLTHTWTKRPYRLHYHHPTNPILIKKITDRLSIRDPGQQCHATTVNASDWPTAMRTPSLSSRRVTNDIMIQIKIQRSAELSEGDLESSGKSSTVS